MLMNVEINPEALEELKSKLTTKNAIKVVFGTLISLGAAAAVIAMMKNPIKNARGITKILMAMGVFTIGCKVGTEADDYFKETVDNVADSIADIKKELKEEGVDISNAANSIVRRDSKQQPEKQNNSGAELGGSDTGSSGKTSGSTVWWSRKSKKEAAK